MNPFASRRIRPESNLYRFASNEKSDLIARTNLVSDLLETLERYRRAAIVGPHGTGKSTLLRSLESSLRARYDAVALITLRSERRHTARELLASFPELESGPGARACLIIDGYEQLRWRDRAAILFFLRSRRSSSLLITSHRAPIGISACFHTRFDESLTRFLTSEKLTDLPESVRNELWIRFEQQLNSVPQDQRNLRELWFAMYDEYEKIRQQEKQAS